MAELLAQVSFLVQGMLTVETTEVRTVCTVFRRPHALHHAHGLSNDRAISAARANRCRGQARGTVLTFAAQ